MYKSICVAALCAATVSAADHAQVHQIKPGLWESTVSIELPAFGGMQTTTNSSCITPEDAAQGPHRLFQDTKGECEIISHSYGEGTFALKMECRADSGSMTITSLGTYTRTDYDMTSITQTNFDNVQMTIQSKGYGRFLGPCEN